MFSRGPLMDIIRECDRRLAVNGLSIVIVERAVDRVFTIGGDVEAGRRLLENLWASRRLCERRREAALAEIAKLGFSSVTR